MFADRYLAISRPLLYVPVRTPRLVFCWILAVNILSGIHPASRTKSSNFSLFLSPRLCSGLLRLVRQPSSGSDLQRICSGQLVIYLYMSQSLSHCWPFFSPVLARNVKVSSDPVIGKKNSFDARARVFSESVSFMSNVAWLGAGTNEG